MFYLSLPKNKFSARVEIRNVRISSIHRHGIAGYRDIHIDPLGLGIYKGQYITIERIGGCFRIGLYWTRNVRAGSTGIYVDLKIVNGIFGNYTKIPMEGKRNDKTIPGSQKVKNMPSIFFIITGCALIDFEFPGIPGTFNSMFIGLWVFFI